MSANKFLFIGGPKDGKRETLPPNFYPFQMQCVQRTGIRTMPDPNSVFDPSFGITTHTYTAKVLKCGKTVYMHSSVSDLIEQLVKGYRYHRKPKYR